jgi:flagellar L-ring protein precursor FlgH
MRSRLYSILMAVIVTAGWLAPAAAQNNSLFGGGRRAQPTGHPDGVPPAQRVPTTQPATPPPAGAVTPAVMRSRQTSAENMPDATENVTLLTVSPIAVQLPEAEEVAINDFVTIIVRESKTATSDAKTESKKDWSLESELSKWLKLSDKNNLVPALFEHGNPAIEFEFKHDYGADGKYDRRDELVTRITARVIDVKPNGNLVLEATKSIYIDEDGYTIALTGACRSRDVTPANTILSTQLHGLDVQVRHTGSVRDATRRGWLVRMFDFLRPI